MKNQNKSLNGPKRKVLFTTPSSVSPDQAESQKNKKLFSTWIIFSLKELWILKEIATLTLQIFLKVKVMDPVFHLEVSDKPPMPELIQFGILSQISSSEIETKLFIFQLFWSLITVMHWMTRLCSEHAKEF